MISSLDLYRKAGGSVSNELPKDQSDCNETGHASPVIEREYWLNTQYGKTFIVLKH
jgi:hypothetical protein